MNNKDGIPVLSVRHLKKEFRYYGDRPSTLKAYLVGLGKGKWRFGGVQKNRVLDDVSFDIRGGEFVGIMGANGVGKSTLLKLISGIYAPTEGEVVVNGQIAPMIELGAGFHPELSGYENIFLNAAILGYGRKAIQEQLDSIIEFSELGEKIQMPVKYFSSGMLARLGFAVATHLPAPIILIDEILAVGDVGFQEKCLKKIKQLHAEGRTLILISHDVRAIRDHCTRCIVLAERKLVFDGDPKAGVAKYESFFSKTC
jgi:ABC-2 type transport system ATP-binding protein